MKRPAFQFYPADWRNNANLRRCSWAARGVWIEVMGLMHDSDEYGTLHWSLKEIAQALGCQVSLMKELASKEVLKGCDSGRCTTLIYVPRSGRRDGEPVTLISEQNGPIWYSSRMVKDEHVRTVRGESSRFGETNGDAPKQSLKPYKSDWSTSSSSSSGKPNSVEREERGETIPTPAGAICARLRKSGIAAVNPSHPGLLALIDAGATADELGAIADEPNAKKGFAWVLATATGRRRDAAAAGVIPEARASPVHQSRHQAQAATIAGLTSVGTASSQGKPNERDITGESRRID